LRDKWDCTAYYVMLWEVILVITALVLLFTTTVLSDLTFQLPCDSLGAEQAEKLAEWSYWSSRFEAATSDGDFLCFLCFLVLSSVQAGEQLQMSVLSRRQRSLLLDTRHAELAIGTFLAWAYMVFVFLSMMTHPVLAPATAHDLECSLAGSVELGTTHGVFLGLAFLAGCIRLPLKLALVTERTGPLIIAFFGSLMGGLVRILVLFVCLLLGFAGENATIVTCAIATSIASRLLSHFVP
jgi:hypothetical protein